MGFMPVRKCDVVLGKPLPYSLYDGDRTLLLRAGCVVQTQNQLDKLSEKGLYRNPSALSGRGRRDAIESDADTMGEKVRESQFGLDDIRLAIGENFQLQGAAEGDASRYAVKLIGYLKGKSVIVSTPTVDNKFAFIREGQSFVVRFFCGKVAYAFVSSVFKSANVPFPHMHLTYPSSVRGLVVRRGVRARVNIISAAVDSRGKSFAATLCDLSTGGGMLVGGVQMGDVGDTLTLKFRVTLNGEEHYLHPVAVIRSIGTGDGSTDGIPAGFQHGLQFVEVPTTESLALTTLVYEKLLQESAEI
jgi:c-di-GMP-binding flagellar brake protein YcgR